MKRLSAETLKSMQIDMLKYIDSICKKNQLRYFAAYGTLLGAIRHKGFIPWDDDIDLYMHRDDIETFVKVVNMQESYYEIISMFNTKNYYHPFYKLSDKRTILIENGFPKKYEQGIYIDIFILDNLPEKEQDAVKQYRKCHRLMIANYTLMNNSFPKDKKGKDLIKSVLVWAYVGLVQFFGLEYQLKVKFKKQAEKIDFANSSKVFPECNFYNEMYDRSVFDRYLYVGFEDTKIRIPYYYEECLRQCYGDYMQLPPEEQRVATHASVAYWKD